MDRKPLEDNAHQAQRADQVHKRAQIERKNPFSPENREARRQAAIKALRQERGVPEPRHVGAIDDQSGADSSGGDVRGGTTEPHSEPRDSASPQDDVKADKTPEAPKDDVPEWYKRQEALRVAEQRAQEATASAERQRAEIERAKAEADAALERMAAAKDDPIQFLSEVGMTKDEWDHFLANGGKMSPEQKKMRDMAANLQKMQERLEAAEKKATEREMQARLAAEESVFTSQLQEFTYVPSMGGVAAVRQRQRLLESQTGKPVGLADAAKHLEQEMKTGLERLLQNPKIRSSLNLDVNTSHAGQAAETPRTLSNRVSSESSQKDAKPHPLDWATKRKLYQQRVQQAQAAKTGR